MEEARGLTGMICCGRENEASMDRRGSVARYVASFEGCCSLPPMKTCSFRGCDGSGGTRAKTNGWAATVEEPLLFTRAAFFFRQVFFFSRILRCSLVAQEFFLSLMLMKSSSFRVAFRRERKRIVNLRLLRLLN